MPKRKKNRLPSKAHIDHRFSVTEGQCVAEGKSADPTIHAVGDAATVETLDAAEAFRQETRLKSWELLERFSAAFDSALYLLEMRGARSEECHGVHCLLTPLRADLEHAMDGLYPLA